MFDLICENHFFSVKRYSFLEGAGAAHGCMVYCFHLVDELTIMVDMKLENKLAYSV
mgnify:CR=1 FL=1